MSCACTLYTYICWQATAAIIATFERVFIRFYIFEIPLLIKIPPTVKYALRSVIRYLSAKGVKAVEIHRNICEVYGQNTMSDEMVRKWVRAFTDVHGGERSGRPSVISDDLLQKVDEKVKMNRRFTISSLSEEFPQVSRSVLYEIVSKRLNRVAVGITSGGKFL